MRHKILLFCCLLGLAFINPLISQSDFPSFPRIISPDSLRAFDETAFRVNAISEGLLGREFDAALHYAQKQHIINTYYPNYYDIENYKTEPVNNIFNAPCVNEGFENGNFTGWTLTRGTNTNSCAYPTATIPIVAGPLATVIPTPLVDPMTFAAIPNSPLGGTLVARLGNTVVGSGKVTKMVQNFVVTNNNYLYDFAFYAIQNGIHTCCQQPYMFVRLRDCLGNLLACPNWTFNAPSGMCAGTGGTWINTGLGAPNNIWRSNGWQVRSLDLTQYIGTCITVEMMIADCSPTGHYLYTYFDSRCNTMNLTVNGTSTLSMPSQTVTPLIACGTTATLTAPTGLNPYNWNGPPLSGVTNNTNQTISASVAGNYSLVMTPIGICTPITRIVNLQFVPPATVTALPAGGICVGGQATLTATGATNYTWLPGGLNTATITVSPTTTTIYSLTANTGTCTGTFTVQVLVNPQPTISIVASSASVCSAMPTTLTASGGNTYTWNPGALTGSQVVVSPTISTTYSVLGNSGPGCTGTQTINITVVPTPTNFITFSNPPTICAGGTAGLFASALGATSYTWFPGAIVGNSVNVTPTVTTIYTVIAANGSCTNSAVQTVSVSAGPSLTVSATPTAICPGGSSTLTAIGAIAYTWNPMGIFTNTAAVSPTITTTYTVIGSNLLGCTSTSTISQVVSPIPSLTISPASPSICIGTSGTLVASGATSYSWNPGALTGATVVVSPTVNTTYSIIGSNGTCTSSTTRSITVVPVPTVTASGSSPSICAGATATLTGNGATSYTWNPGGLTGVTVAVSPTVNTTYTVIGNSGGCTSTATVALAVFNGPTLTASANPTNVCTGSSSTLSVLGGISYTWNPGALTGASISVNPPVTTIYSVTGNNISGCTTTQTVSLNVTPNPTVTASASSSTICNGSSATLTGNGATSYTWSPGALTGATVVVSPTVNTIYTVNALSGGCPGQTTISINVVPAPTVTANSSPTAICSGASATLTANGATTYTWMPGALSGSNVVVTPTTNTTYTVTGNSGGCSSSSTVALVVNPSPTVTSNATPTSVCLTGNMTLTASGASTYTWMPGALTGSNIVITPTISSIYSVTGTNGFSCTATSTINVVVNSVPVLTLTASPATLCNGSSSTLTASGATSYTWNPGALTGSNVVVSPTLTTTYTVTGSNGGCSSTGTISININPSPNINAVAVQPTICAGNTSTLIGAGALNYTWNPGGMNGNIVFVTPTITTTYTLIGANVFGCTNTTNVTVTVTPLPNLTITASPTAICSGGSSTLTANGATTYTWNPGALTGSNITVSPTITTIYTVTGANGNCTGTQTLTLIVNPTPTLITGALPNPICLGSNVTLTVSGASTYTWNPGALTGSNIVVTPTISTSYTVNGTSISGCTATAIRNVTVNPLPTLTVSSSNTNICSGTSATLTASGANTYTWNPGALNGTTVSVSPTITTVYTVTGTSILGCTNTITFTQVVTPNPTVTANASPTSICIGGSSTLTANGATSYTWNPGALSGSMVVVSPTATTIYTITGANGSCTGTQTLNLIVNPTPTLIANAAPNPVCFGSNVTLTVSGASTYSWNPGALTGSNVVVTPTTNTSYTVIGSSISGCTATSVVNVTVNPLPTLTVSSTNTNICAGASATLTGSGASTYTWNPGALVGSTISVTPLVTTVYTLTGASISGCTATINFTQVVTPNPTVIATASPTNICSGFNATLSANGATTYTWNPGALTGSNVIVTPTTSTVYTVTGANGLCINVQTVSLIVTPSPTLVANASPSVICNGNSVTLTVNGANTYTWSPGALTGSNVVVTPTANTVYTVIGTGTIVCNGITTVSVIVNPLPTLTVTSSNTNICENSSATLTAAGAVSYTWNPGALVGTTISVTPTVTTVYTITGTSISGCTATTNFTQVVTPNPTIIATASPTNICSGFNATLTANGATTYTWNPGALTGSNIIVTPTTSTIYTVTGANGLCTNVQTVSLFVTPSPTLVANASPSVICNGNSVTLTVNGANTYTWSPGALTGSNVVVTPTSSTVYTVLGTGTLACNGITTVSVIVNPIPSLTITGTATNICIGSSATLTASGATSYTWNPGAITGSTLAVSPTITTVYTLTGQNPSTCSNVSQFTLVVSPTPTVTAAANNTLVCSGSPSTLTAVGATSYTWMPGALSGSNVVVTPSVNTTYTVNGSNGACTSSFVVTVSVIPSPTMTANASPTLFCGGGTTTLSATGAITYAWLPIGLVGQTVSTTPTITTTYTVIGSNGTCTNSAMVTVSVNPIPTLAIVASPTSVCIGSSATLTASGALNYTWQPGGLNTTTILVTPTVNTTYTLLGANGACTSSTSISITVNPIPTVTANANPTIVCSGSTVNLTAGGAITYTWSPGAQTGSNVIETPTVNTTYTVIGSNINGCTNTAVVNVSVNPAPTVVAIPSPTSICVGGTATITASGAVTYTWNPGALSGSLVSVNPTVTTIYTITGTGSLGCTGTTTVQLLVLPIPTVTAISSPTAICFGSSATLTANGALTYTWNPGAMTGSNVVVNPTVTTTYTVTGENGTCGSSTTTITIIVNDLPANVTASVSSIITCATPSVNLLGSTTSTNVSYLWNGPGGYTSAVQNPTGIAIPGTYTFIVTNLSGGCSSMATVAVTTDSAIPTATITLTGTITCANPMATLTAVASVTNAGYNWSGPGGFTNTAVSCSISLGGTYTLTVTDLNNNCPASTIIVVGTDTNVPITATITPATCNGTVANNDAKITASGFIVTDKYDFVIGATYTGTATYATATLIPISGIITNTLNNPLSPTPYTVRFFGLNGCFKDTTLFLNPTSCLTNTVFGIAKAVSTPTLKPNGTYDVNYSIVVKNSGAQQLNNVMLIENLANTFPLPTTYSIISAPLITSLGSSLSLDGTFNGSVQTVMTNTVTSILPAGKTDTIMFSVNINPNGIFGPFNNSVIGWSSPTIGVVFGDSSNTGYDPDPDLDTNPTNNNLPTILNLPPNLFFGLTKVGSRSEKLDDDSYDISYTVTVHNLGNDTLRNVIVKDSLFKNTIKDPATYTMKSGPFATGSLVANPSFNGNGDAHLIISAQSKLPPGMVATISFTINMKPDTVTVVRNSATGSAVSSGSVIVTDISNDGIDPDVNDNGVWNEDSDNKPTIITLPSTNLFVPNGFSPDGDGKNDVWFIKGLPKENTVTIYNRWGNKVYQKTEYDNSWNGHPNVSGTLGTNKLSQGTYYYVIEFKDGSIKPLNGFVVIHY